MNLYKEYNLFYETYSLFKSNKLSPTILTSSERHFEFKSLFSLKYFRILLPIAQDCSNCDTF